MKYRDATILTGRSAGKRAAVDAALDEFLAPMQIVTVDEHGTRVVTVDPHAETREALARRRAARTLKPGA